MSLTTRAHKGINCRCHLTFIFSLLFLFSITGKAEASVINISSKEAAQLILENQNNMNFTILDIRTPREFSAGHIENAVLLDFYSKTFISRLKELNPLKTYLIYCRTGNRSNLALPYIKGMGFFKVYHLANGIREWQKTGYKVVR